MLKTLIELGPLIFVAALVVYENFKPLVIVISAIVAFMWVYLKFR